MNEIEVQILKIEHDFVQIGITAPPDIPVHRLEVFDRINTEEGSVKKSKRAARKLDKPL